MKKPFSTSVAIWVVTNLVWLGVVVILWKQREPKADAGALALQMNQPESTSILGAAGTLNKEADGQGAAISRVLGEQTQDRRKVFLGGGLEC